MGKENQPVDPNRLSPSETAKLLSAAAKLKIPVEQIKRDRTGDAKGERFSLQGKRWRFPRGLSSMEVDTRISRLRELWSDHERFCESQLLVDLTANSQMSRSLLVKRCGLLEGRAVGEKRESLAEKGLFPNTEEASWTSLSLWIAEQIKLGVQLTTPHRIAPL